MNAVISECGKYRYVLRRSLGSILRWHHPVLFIMLNPSTADAEKDDPTIRRCMAFAKREGFTHLNVVNLYALRSPDPKHLALSADPIGPENDAWIDKEVRGASAVIVAWGAHAFAADRAKDVVRRVSQPWCLGKTKDGSPKHPLARGVHRIPDDQAFMEYQP